MVLAERLLAALVVIARDPGHPRGSGFNLTTVLAGLGIGGIAIAFAAQKTLENLFGGIFRSSRRSDFASAITAASATAPERWKTSACGLHECAPTRAPSFSIRMARSPTMSIENFTRARQDSV